MKIINLSYRRFPITNPLQWIRGFRLFYGIWEEVATKHEVQYLHFSNLSTTIVENGLQHCFLDYSTFSLNFPFRLHQKIQREKPDVILVHGLMFPGQILLLSIQCPGVKIWVQHHAEKPARHPIKRWLQRMADRRIEGYFFTAADMANDWLDEGLIDEGQKLHELMEVSSVFEQQSKEESRRRLGLNSTRILLWVGHLNENKNPLLALNAFLHLQEKQAVDLDLIFIFQSNKLLEELKAQLADHPIAHRVHLIGRVAHEEMQYWHSAADFILSTSWYESGGTSVCEAMSCRCVPILSDIPSFRFMAGKSGFLFEAGDEPSLINALEKALAADYSDEQQKAKQRYDEALSFEAIARNLDHFLTQG
jgi:glycosyltransferase involved in cell wall biosynthesis